MTDFNQPHFDERLEAYLDGIMAEEERLEFEKEIEASPLLAEEVALQQRINTVLVLNFPSVAPSAQHIASMERHVAAATVPAEAGSVLAIRWDLIVSTGVIAASLLCGYMLWHLNSESRPQPYFAARPLVDVYRDTVANGFEPYYECRDDKRFADTFELRQGVPLHLAKLPLGSAMKGLSYPGGLSRETTAMLCDVEGKPVMVFVDREENDQRIAANNSDPNLRIFREVRDGLVFYEVTPHAEPTMTDFMVADEGKL